MTIKLANCAIQFACVVAYMCFWFATKTLSIPQFHRTKKNVGLLLFSSGRGGASGTDFWIVERDYWPGASLEVSPCTTGAITEQCRQSPVKY